MNHTPPTEISTLSLHDALPISTSVPGPRTNCVSDTTTVPAVVGNNVYVGLCPSTAAPTQGLFKFAMASGALVWSDRKSTRLNSSHLGISYAVFCLKKKKQNNIE